MTEPEKSVQDMLSECMVYPTRFVLNRLAAVQGSPDYISGVEDGMEAVERMRDLICDTLPTTMPWGGALMSMAHSDTRALPTNLLFEAVEARANTIFRSLCNTMHRFGRSRAAYSQAIRDSRLGVGLVRITFTVWENRGETGGGDFAATLNYENLTIKVSHSIPAVVPVEQPVENTRETLNHDY